VFLDVADWAFLLCPYYGRAIGSSADRRRVADTERACRANRLSPTPRRTGARPAFDAVTADPDCRPFWVGDAILSEPLVARLAALHENASIDVLAPAWCAPVYARMRGVRRTFDSTLRHGELGWAKRRAPARTLSTEKYARAVVLPNSWKSALVPWLAGIPRRTGYTGEMRMGLVNDRGGSIATPRRGSWTAMRRSRRKPTRPHSRQLADARA
jgi:hypothetical protein